MKLRQFIYTLSLCFSIPLFIYPVYPSRVSVQQARWIEQSSGSLAKLSGVFFVDRDRGWVVGANGTLLSTENGGSKWSHWEAPEKQKKEALNDLWFFNADRGLLLGEYGLGNRIGADWSERVFLLICKDRGAIWETGSLERQLSVNRNDERPTPGTRAPDPILLKMSFANNRSGWAVGESGTIQRTKDGGANWTAQHTSTRKLLYGVAAVDDNKGWAVGAGGTILHTADGGSNWSEQTSGVAYGLRSVHFLDTQHGWAVGEQGTIVTTSNGGESWRKLKPDVDLNLNDVVFLKSKEGPGEGWIACDHGLLLRTTDGGASWEKVELNARANILRLFFIAPDCGWAVGASGSIFKFGRVS